MEPAKELQPEPEDLPQRRELHIPLVTFIKIGAALLLGYALYVLWPLLLLIFLALFLAVTLHAYIGWLENKGLKRWQSLTLVIGTLLTVLILALALIVPTLTAQVGSFVHNLPKLREDALHRLPQGGPIREYLEHLMDNASWSAADASLGKFVSAGSAALGGLADLLLLLVIALYLVIDGTKSYEWLLAFFSPLNRRKLRMTSKEVSDVIFGYVSGQFFTSTVVTIYTFVVLTVLKVPGALMLAIMAGVFDILPIVGILISTAPAFLLALSVSLETALLVVGMYLVFHLLEAYLIVPKVYGRNLRVSTLSVLLGLLVGSLLAGIPGAIAALPIIASYDAIERIWLQPFLRDGVLEKHEMQKDQEFGEKQ